MNMPYILAVLEDGTEIAFDRDYAPICVRAPGQPTRIVAPDSIQYGTAGKVFAGYVYRDDGATSEVEKRTRAAAALRYFGIEPSDTEIEIDGRAP
jgi:hypothetical protein